MKRMKITAAVLVMGILACLVYIIWLITGYITADEEYNNIREHYMTEQKQGDDGEEPESPIPDLDIDIEGLLAANPDFVAWLYYPDGKVDYPVVKEREEDINGYLHKSFDGKKSSSGCLFIPYDADERFVDLNTFVYGHNMANGSMFGSLKKLIRTPDESYTHPYFFVYNKDGDRIMYRVISIYVAHKNSPVYAVPESLSGYEEYLETVLASGSMDKYIPFSDSELEAMERHKPIVTFSVCYGRAGTSNRQLVHGVEVLREHRD